MALADDVKTKSFWVRPEGTAGMITLAIGAVGLYFALPTLLAFMGGLVTLLGQTIAVTALCAVLAAIGFVVTNGKVQTLAGYMFKSAMRKITSAFVEIDPIGIMRSYIDDLKKKRQVMAASKEKLSGQITVLRRQIDMNDQQYSKAMATAKVANDKGMAGAFQVNSRQAGRLEKLNKESFGPLLIQMQLHARALDKYFEVTGTVIDDLGNEVQARKMEREMILASYSAMSAAKKILTGGTDQKELFDQAMEFVVEDFGMKMGEIDSFMESSKGFVEGLDLQNGVYEADALEKLKVWESKADSILLGSGGKQQLLEQSTTSSLNQTAIPVSGQIIDYHTLINKNNP